MSQDIGIFSSATESGSICDACYMITQMPSLQKSLNARHIYTDSPITLKLSAIVVRNSIYKMYISEFWYRWPKVSSILRPPHYLLLSQWEKIERRLYCTKTIRSTLKHRFTYILDILNRNIATSDPSLCHRGHLKSWKGHQQFFRE